MRMEKAHPGIYHMKPELHSSGYYHKICTREEVYVEANLLCKCEYCEESEEDGYHLLDRVLSEGIHH